MDPIGISEIINWASDINYQIEVLYNAKHFTRIIFKISRFCRNKSTLIFAYDPMGITNILVIIFQERQKITEI